MMINKVFIGTSGWVYPHWIDNFYPVDLPQNKWLSFYAKHFPTVEVNATFYHQMRPKTFANWQKQVPDNFLFSIKVSRFITHILRLKNLGRDGAEYFENINKILNNPLFLFQLPPSFKKNKERLEFFLNLLPKGRFAFEFRHPSWFANEIYGILSKHNISLVIADSSSFPKVEEVTADFVYLRFHGSGSLYSSCYSEKELDNWSKKIKKWVKEGKEVYAYFNNDFEGFAIKNAQTLIKILISAKMKS